MTAPLTPPGCDLRDFRFMPLDVVRLRDSDLAALETPEACWAAVQLWGASWHQVPAGSLPDDDRVLAQLAGYGRVVKEWLRIKVGALRGFVKCADGRLYHPVVAEKAVEAWRGKLAQRWRTECARIKKHNQRTGESLVPPTLEQFLAGQPGSVAGDTSNVPGDIVPVSPSGPSGNTVQGKGIGTGIGNSSVSNETGAEPPPDDVIDRFRKQEPKAAAWNFARHILQERGGLDQRRAGEMIGKWVRDHGLSPEDIWQITEAAWRCGTRDAVPYMAKAAARVEADRGSTAITEPSERQQRAWMEDWRDRPASWRVYERGPRPGEDGCRIAPEIQREFTKEEAA